MNNSPPKAILRTQFRAARLALTASQRAAAAEALCAHLMARPDLLRNFGQVAVYLASPLEVDLTPVIERLLALGQKLVAPRGDGFARLTRITRLELDARGTPMPHGEAIRIFEIDLFLVPGVAFTRQGARIGQGGGWYDRALARKASGALCIGVAFDQQLAEVLPSEPHDITMDYVVTPTRLIDCHASAELHGG